jgi:hypothetical protein
VGLLEEHNAVGLVGGLIDRFDGTPHDRMVRYDVARYPFPHHAEAALTHLSHQLYLGAWHLPLVYVIWPRCAWCLDIPWMGICLTKLKNSIKLSVMYDKRYCKIKIKISFIQ